MQLLEGVPSQPEHPGFESSLCGLCVVPSHTPKTDRLGQLETLTQTGRDKRSGLWTRPRTNRTLSGPAGESECLYELSFLLPSSPLGAVTGRGRAHVLNSRKRQTAVECWRMERAMRSVGQLFRKVSVRWDQTFTISSYLLRPN